MLLARSGSVALRCPAERCRPALFASTASCTRVGLLSRPGPWTICHERGDRTSLLVDPSQRDTDATPAVVVERGCGPPAHRAASRMRSAVWLRAALWRSQPSRRGRHHRLTQDDGPGDLRDRCATRQPALAPRPQRLSRAPLRLLHMAPAARSRSCCSSTNASWRVCDASCAWSPAAPVRRRSRSSMVLSWP